MYMYGIRCSPRRKMIVTGVVTKSWRLLFCNNDWLTAYYALLRLFFFIIKSKMQFFCPSFEPEFYQLSPTMCTNCMHKDHLIDRIESLIWSSKAAYNGMLQVRLKVAQLTVSQCLRNVYLMLMKYSCWSEWKRITGNSSVRMPLSSILSCHLMHKRMGGRECFVLYASPRTTRCG